MKLFARPLDLEMEPAGAISGRYELVRRLAAGGMGEVYIARARGGRFEKRVALKLLLPHLSEEPEFVRRFQDEARLAARMDHPNVVQVFDMGIADGRHYIAMPLIDGVPLSRLLARARAESISLPMPLVRLIAVGLCEGLRYVHELKDESGRELGLVHRDVNPSNLMISSSGAVLLTDFGIAKAMGMSQATRPGKMFGKAAYMAPEQIIGKGAVDRRTDVYAAALTLYEAATGLNPFRRDGDLASIDAVMRGDVKDPRELRPELSEREARAVMRGLGHFAKERPATAEELLEAFIDGPVARPKDLGLFVQTLCAGELPLERTDTSPPLPPPPRTQSLLHPRPERRRKPVLMKLFLASLLVGSMCAAGALAGALIWRAPGPELALTHVGPVASGPAGLLEPASAASVPAAFLAARPAATAQGSRGSGLTEASARAPAPTDGTGRAAPARAPSESGPLEPASPPSREPAPDRAQRPARLASAATPAADDDPGQDAPEPAAKPARRPGSSAVGYLSADAVPWAGLWVGGKEVDRTPVSRYPLPAGKHVLIFRNPELGKEVRRTVVIREGRVERLRVEFPP